MTKQKITALRKLTRARNFIVITDDEALMQVDMGNTTDLNRTITLAQQRAMLDQFKRQVDSTIKKFDAKLSAQTTRKKGKKIPVQG